jgi:hypothetical protein
VELSSSQTKKVQVWKQWIQVGWNYLAAKLHEHPERLMGATFVAPSKTTAEHLAGALKQGGFWHVVLRRRWYFLRRTWTITGQGPLPVPLTAEVLCSWIERMASLAADHGSKFIGWAPIAPAA